MDARTTWTSATDTGGLICGFQLSPLERLAPDSLGRPTEGGPVWLHLNLSDSRARRWLEHREDISEEAREILLDPDARIRSVVTGHAVVTVLGDLHHDFKGEPEGLGVIRIYVDAHKIITLRAHPLKSSDDLRRQLLAGQIEPGTPLGLFEHYLCCLAETFTKVVADLAEETDDTEEEVLAGHFKDKGSSLGKMRRLLARLRRQMAANRTALVAVAGRLPDHSAEHRQNLRHAIEPFEALGQDLELVQERARLLQEEIAGRLSEATNRNLFVLSIVTTTLLPITLITGIFGMNVGGLPWTGSPLGFWWVIVLMALSVVVVLRLLRKRSVL